MAIIRLLILVLCLSCNTPPKDCEKENFYGYPCKEIDFEKFEEFQRRAKPFRGDRN